MKRQTGGERRENGANKKEKKQWKVADEVRCAERRRRKAQSGSIWLRGKDEKLEDEEGSSVSAGDSSQHVKHHFEFKHTTECV